MQWSWDRTYDSISSEFETQHSKLDGHFLTLICCEKFIVCLKTPHINEKEAEDVPLTKLSLLIKWLWIQFHGQIFAKHSSATLIRCWK